jgi:hypothetical protein
MTKKHFEALAAALSKSRAAAQPLEGLGFAQWYRDTRAVADVCARFNPNFARARFLAACGVEG